MSPILGALPTLEAVLPALNRSATQPAGFADQLPPMLQAAGWLGFEHSLATNAEVAYVRWLDVAKASGSQAPARLLAESLHTAKCTGIVFRPDGQAFPATVEALGDLAFGMTALLAGRVYALPVLPWDLKRAAAIQADIEAEASQAPGSPPWKSCADREWLADEIERQAAQQVPAQRK